MTVQVVLMAALSQWFLFIFVRQAGIFASHEGILDQVELIEIVLFFPGFLHRTVWHGSFIQFSAHASMTCWSPVA